MNEIAIEAIVLAINALGCGILLMVSGVVQKIMNGMEPLEFKKFLNALDRTAMSDPFAVAIATIPIFVVVFYFVEFGFVGHWWFTSGIILWLTGASITKVTNQPIYNWVGKPEHTDPEELKKKRHTLALGNRSRAWVTLLSVAVMACQFSVAWTLVAVASLVVIAYPALWVARKYIPDGTHR